MSDRITTISRKTAETDISLELNLDGTGIGTIETGIGFLDHMLTALCRHALFDMKLRAVGDLHIDFHHTTEDIGIVIGQALLRALGEKRGISRFGHAVVPMDEALALAADIAAGLDAGDLHLGVTGEDLLRERGVDLTGAFACAINNVFVPRPTWPQRSLSAGDRVDVIAPITGG